jgi:hypothetical protein
MTPENPFAVLELEPTTDINAVKRAYFAALRRHPPHVDAAAFQRVRAAYEALSKPAPCLTHFFSSPINATALLAASEARYAAAFTQAAQSASTEDPEVLRAEFVRRFSTSTLAEVLFILGNR